MITPKSVLSGIENYFSKLFKDDEFTLVWNSEEYGRQLGQDYLKEYRATTTEAERRAGLRKYTALVNSSSKEGFSVAATRFGFERTVIR